MDAITYSAARQHLAETMDKVTDDRAPILITRQKGEPVIMMSLAEYDALQETAYLLRSPANAKRLIRSIENLRQGKVETKILIDPEA